MSAASGSAGSQPRQSGFHIPQVQRILPGPAGKLQELAAAGALDQATPEVLGLRESASSNAAANPCLHDPCFQSAVWTRASDFVAQQEARNGSAGQLHTVTMAKKLSLGKVPKMLVLLGSYHPSGSGSAFSKIKDPTGSMGAALHCSALERQQQLGPGCVLLLQQVSVFTPAPGTSYLAVTASNIVKVWSAEPAQDRIRNALHRQQHQQQHEDQQQQQQQQQQRTQAPGNTRQQDSRQPAALFGSANHSQQQQQQPQGLHQGTRGCTKRQQGNTQQQQVLQRQMQGTSGTDRCSQLPPPSPHLPGLINRSNSRPGTQQQFLNPSNRQQPYGMQQQQQQQQRAEQLAEQQGEFSPAVSYGSGPGGIMLRGAADAAAAAAAAAGGCAGAGDSVMPGSRTQHPGAAAAAASGSMPPPPPRIQPSSFRGQLQILQQTQQQQQQQQQCMQHQQGVGVGGELKRSASQQPDSQQVPTAILGGPPQRPGHNTNQTLNAAAHHRQAAPAGAGAGMSGSKGMDDAAADGVDDVVAAIFGSQLGGLQGPPAAPALPAAAAIFGSQVAGEVQAPLPPAGRFQQQQQQHPGLGRQASAADRPASIAAEQAPASDQVVQSQKRFKSSGAGVTGAVLPGGPPASQVQGGWLMQPQQRQKPPQQQQQLLLQVQSGQVSQGAAKGGSNVSGGLPQQQQQQHFYLGHGASAGSSAGSGRSQPPGAGADRHFQSAKVPAVRPGTAALGSLRPPTRQLNLMDDLLAGDLEDMDF